jgi:hypothetical protein
MIYEMKQKLFLFLLISLIFIINYSIIDSFLVKSFEEDYEIGIVERVIDGDTVVVNGTSVRLLGINCPERGEEFYVEAKEFLEDLVLSEEVKVYFGKDKFDKYKRKLGYVFLDNKNVNLELVSEGYANPYFPSGKDKFYESFFYAWDECLNSNVNLCEKSKEYCVQVIDWNYEEDYVLLENTCSYSVDLEDWNIKDEGRKKYVFGEFILGDFENIKITNEDFNETYVWTNSGDSIFLRDGQNKLAFFDNY